MLGRDPGCNDMAWQMNPMRKVFHWNSPQIVFCSICNALYPHTDFFNMIHLWAIVRHVKCTFLDCFYTYLQLKRAISVLIFISSHLFCVHMFRTDSGWSNMAWQMMSLSPLGGISLIWSKNHFCSMYTSVSPQKHFFNIMNWVGIASHITCTFLSDYTINFHVYMPISVYILIFLHIFCLGMLGIDCGCRDMAWQIAPLIFDWRLQWHFHQVDSPSGSDIVWNWHLCQMFEYFYIFEHILPHFDAQYHIHNIIIVSYTWAICHLHHYPT